MISIKTLKDNYLLDDNIDDKYVISAISKSQDFIIRKVLGVTKYKQLLSDIESGSVNSEDEILLKEYIHPVLAYYVISEVIFATAYKLKNAPDYQDNPNTDRFEELVRVSKKYANDSQAYEQILREYICDNNIVLSTTDGPVLKSGYKTGIFLG